MTMTRRDFLGTTLAVTASTAFAPPARAATPLKVLVIGGTGFLGPHTVRRLQERGHTVTCSTVGSLSVARGARSSIPGVSSALYTEMLEMIR